MNRRSWSPSVVVVAMVLWAAPAAAEVSLLEGETLGLRLGGFVSSFSAYRWTGYDTGGLVPETSGLNAAVLRLEWKANLGESTALDVQNRFFWSLAPAGTVGAVGLGATVPPDRTLDLRSEIVDEEGVLLEHDLDRLALSVFTPIGDVTVGRQAVTWGNSSIFTTSDLWTQFSPFELDTSQKRGVDALRIISYPWDGFEIEAIVVDRGDIDRLSGGVRAGWTLGKGDYYGGVGRNYDNIWGLMGLAVDLSDFRGHAEMALPFDPDSQNLRLPRATVGIDYFSSQLTGILEYHFNGPGAADSEDYLATLSSPEFARGELYFVGRHYAGLVLAYLLWDDLVTLSTSSMVNILDPSVLFAPSVSYQLSQSVSATLGGYFGFGEDPSFDLGAVPPLQLGSEFGLYGNLVFLQIAGYI